MTPTTPTPPEQESEAPFSIFALSGYKGSGKTTAAGMLQAISLGDLAIRSFATPLKVTLRKMNPVIDPETGLRLEDAMRTHGEDGVKQRFPEYRRLMQGMNSIKDFDQDFYGRIGAESTVALAAGGHFEGVVFDDARFPSELHSLDDAAEDIALGMGRDVNLVTIRLGLPAPLDYSHQMHHTETALDDWEESYTITAESLIQLREELEAIYQEVMSVTE